MSHPLPSAAGLGGGPLDAELFRVERARDPSSSPTLLGAAALRSLELALAVAENPAATPRILGTIASRWGEARPAVCRHPRARWRLLFKLARAHPEAFVANPRAEALVRGEGAAMHAPSPSLVRKLLALEGAPAWLLPALVGHPFAALRAVAAQHASTPTAHLVTLSYDRHQSVRCAAVANPALPPGELFRLVHDASVEVRTAVAERADTPPALLTVLARDADSHVRCLIARRVTDPRAIEQLAGDTDLSVRTYIAENPAAPPAVLRGLAHDDVYTRMRLAQNPSASADVLEALVAQPNGKSLWDDVYAKALSHPNASPRMFESLASSRDEAVRRCVASRPNAPAAVLAKLAGDENDKVRWFVAYYAADEGLLARLARDPNAGVRARVADRTRSTTELARLALDPEAHVRETVAKSEHTDPSTLALLARDTSFSVRSRVAWNHRTPPEALSALALDTIEEVAHCALRNDATPLDALVDALARDRLRGFASTMLVYRVDRASPPLATGALERAFERGGFHAAVAFASCTRLPESIAARIEQWPGPRAALARATANPGRLRRLADDPSREVRESVALCAASRGVHDVYATLAHDLDEAVRRAAASGATDGVVLEALSLDAAASVRERAARSSHAPPLALVVLADDADRGVRMAALCNENTPLGVLLRAEARADDLGAQARATLARLGHPKGRRGG